MGVRVSAGRQFVVTAVAAYSGYPRTTQRLANEHLGEGHEYCCEHAGAASLPREGEMAHRIRRTDQPQQTQLRLEPHRTHRHQRSPNLVRNSFWPPRPKRSRVETPSGGIPHGRIIKPSGSNGQPSPQQVSVLPASDCWGANNVRRQQRHPLRRKDVGNLPRHRIPVPRRRPRVPERTGLMAFTALHRLLGRDPGELTDEIIDEAVRKVSLRLMTSTGSPASRRPGRLTRLISPKTLRPWRTAGAVSSSTGSLNRTRRRRGE